MFKSKTKVMLIAFFDVHGIVHAEFLEARLFGEAEARFVVALFGVARFGADLFCANFVRIISFAFFFFQFFNFTL